MAWCPPYADDVQVAKLADDNETEAEIAADIEAEAPAYEAVEPKGIDAPEPEERAGSGDARRKSRTKAPARAARTDNGDSANPESARAAQTERRAAGETRAAAQRTAAMSEVRD